MALVRALLCITDAALDARMRAMMTLSGRFEIAAFAVPDRLVEAVAVHGPDIVVLESATLDVELQELLTSAGRGRPVPSVVLVPAGVSPDRSMRHWLQQARCNTISASLVRRNDEAAREHVVDKLANVAARIRAGSRRTLSDDDIEDAMDEVLSAATRSDVSADVARLAAWPVDAILLAGGPGAEDLVLEAFDRVSALPVPVLVALAGVGAAELARRLSAVSRVPVSALTGWQSLRATRGAVIVPRGGMKLAGDAITPAAGSERDFGNSLASLAPLGSALTALLLPDPRDQFSGTFADLRRAGSNIGVAEPEGPTPGTRRLLEHANVTASFDVPSVAWYLGHAIPRRD